MVISQIEIGRSTGNKRIGHDHSAFANCISAKYKRTGAYAYDGVSLTFLWQKQDVETKESNVHIAYQLILQELYFRTHNTILVNQKEIFQGIAVSLERQLALVREENNMEAVRLESFVQRLRETRDQENILRIAHEIEDRLGIRGSFDSESGRENETWENEHVFNKSADATKSRAAGVSEMLRTINETQFQNVQQILMETYKKQQLSRSEEAEGSSIGIASELTHRQETVYSSVIDRYFARLQSMIMSEVSQIREADAQETIFEQQRDLLRKVYAESTEREKEDFASYLEQTKLLHQTTDRTVKEYESGLCNKTTVRILDEVQNELAVTIAGEEINAMRVTDNGLATAVMSKTAKVSEMLQTVNEAQFQEMQQILMKSYEKQQLSRLVEAEESQIEIVSGLTHRKKTAYSSVIDRYFAKLQSMVVSEVSQARETDVQQTIFEQQRDLLRKVYAESTEREKEDFASYLEQTKLLHQTTDRTVKEYESGLRNKTIEQASNAIETRLTKELAEQRTSDVVSNSQNEINARLIWETTAPVTNEPRRETAKETTAQVTSEPRRETAKETTAQVTSELHRGITDKTTGKTTVLTADGVQNELAVTTAGEKNNALQTLPKNVQMQSQRTGQPTRQMPDNAMRITDSGLATAVMSKTAKVSEMLQTLNTTQFQEIQEILMEVYEKQQLSRLMETQESGIGIVSGLTHRQKNGSTSIKNTSVIERYFERLQSMIAVKAEQTEKTDAQETIFEQQRDILRKVYAESTEQEKEEFTFCLEEHKLLYKNANKAVRELETKLHDEIANKVSNKVSNEVTNEVTNKVTNEVTNEVTNKVSNEVSNAISNKLTKEFEDRLTKEIADQKTEDAKATITKAIITKAIKTNQTYTILDRTTSTLRNRLVKIAENQAINETGERTIGVVTGLTHVRKNRRSFAIDRYFERVQSMIVSDTLHRENTRTQDEVSRLQQDLLRTVYTGITKQEKEELAQYFEEPRLLYKKAVKKADQQQNETKIQEIVEHCVRRTTRVTDSGTVRRQMDDQKNEIAQLKEKVQRQHEQINEFLRTGNRMPNMDRVYQEIEKRMESRLHLERLRRGM